MSTEINKQNPKVRAVARCLVTAKKLYTMFSSAGHAQLATAAVALTGIKDVDEEWLVDQVEEALNCCLVTETSGSINDRRVWKEEIWTKPRWHPRIKPEAKFAVEYLAERWKKDPNF